MNIKSLLIGSAAASVAATGAQAADAIFVPEPEPMEYVRVCDVYGAGFFYIPGTETCLKIGGKVRMQFDASQEQDLVFPLPDDDGAHDGWDTLVRAEVSLDARQETEYGTLRSYILLRGTNRNGDPEFYPYNNDTGWLSDGPNGTDMGLQKAFISLGGLTLGLDDTLYDASIPGEYDNGGGGRVHFINYTFDMANGVALTVALEEADRNYDYTPNVVGKLGISQGWGSLNGWVAYDATAEEFAVKGIATVKATSALTLYLLGTYESGHSYYSVENNVTNMGGALKGYEYSVGAHAKFQATPKLALGFGGQYFLNDHDVGFDDYAIGGVIDYNIVKNFDAKLALNYRDGENYADGQWQGFLRLDRNF